MRACRLRPHIQAQLLGFLRGLAGPHTTLAVSTLVRHRFLSRSLHTLHETHNDTYTASRGRCNHTATSPPLSFSDLRRGTSASPLSPRTSRPRDQRAGAKNARPPHSQACHLQRSGKRVRKARRRAPPAAPRHRISTRLSHRGGRGRPWAEFPRRFQVLLWASCPGRRRPRSQYRRRFWRPQWQPRCRNRALSSHS